MSFRIFILLFFAGYFFNSCVPSKDIIYLQNKENAENAPVAQIPFKPYRLQVSDVLSVTVSAIDPKLVEIFNTGSGSSSDVSSDILYYNGYLIDDHGNIRLPILGEVNVIALTTDEVREKIETLLLKDHFKKEAGIFVSVKLAGFRYTINGEISQPGTKILNLNKVSVLDAIANAGDITVTGNRKDVMIIRQFPQGVQTFSIDLTNYSALQSPNFYLQPNDYVYVKPLKQKTWGTGTTGIQSLSSIITILSLVTTTFLLLQK
ncbi:MAG: polysaccharide biosynthesis/export family protein [Flavobacterium sp.]|uniref:polysaccharide biosynthesis/export family protein n=1 Tax=Flavobacterium sp. TaxID=239 RepID=UPI0022C213EF|nr:polysaccharide biosynthesis/export family protein [Flavobacterium sp.]MCZ8197328.1 polysaccharide biosynthesis/export family protein [Flavobacterium sp.]